MSAGQWGQPSPDRDEGLKIRVEAVISEASDMLAAGNAEGVWRTGLEALSLIADRQSVRTAPLLYCDVVRDVYFRPRTERSSDPPLWGVMKKDIRSMALRPRAYPLSRDLGGQAYTVCKMMTASRPSNSGALRRILLDCRSRGIPLHWVLDLGLGAVLENDRAFALDGVSLAYEEIPGLYNAFSQIVLMTDRPNELFPEALELLEQDKQRKRLSLKQLLVYGHCLAGSGRDSEAARFADTVYAGYPEANNLRAAMGWIQYMCGHTAGHALRAFQRDDEQSRLDLLFFRLHMTTLALNGRVDEAETRIEALRSQGKNPGDGQALIGWFHDFVVARDAASARKRFSVAREERPLTDRFQGIAQVLHASSVDCPAILRRVKSLYDNDRYLRGVASTCGGAALGIHGDYGAMRELYLYDYAVGRQRPWEQLILLALLQRTGAPEDAPVIQGMHMALSGVFSKTLCQVARRHLYLDGVLEEDVDDLLGLPVLAKIEEDLRQQMPVL